MKGRPREPLILVVPGFEPNPSGPPKSSRVPFGVTFSRTFTKSDVDWASVRVKHLDFAPFAEPCPQVMSTRGSPINMNRRVRPKAPQVLHACETPGLLVSFWPVLKAREPKYSWSEAVFFPTGLLCHMLKSTSGGPGCSLTQERRHVAAGLHAPVKGMR